MKFIHLSDLHLGKRFKEVSLIEDQKYILTEIINIIDDEKPDGVIIAGDVYDRSAPSGEAVELFDDFLVRLVSRNLKVFVVSGNHDSAERVAFGGRIMDKSGIYLSPVYDGTVRPITLTDEYGEISVYLIPFIKPIHVRRFFKDDAIETYTDAMKTVTDSLGMDTSKRNVIVAHQFVTGAERSDSEDRSVGGVDNIDVSAFGEADYIALGHIHGPQDIKDSTARYCGTPLKYSFSEANHQKSVTVIELKEKGNTEIRTIELIPKYDMREIRGTYAELAAKENYENTDTEDYIRAILTDEEDIPDAMRKLQSIYPHLLELQYDNKRTQTQTFIDTASEVETKTPLELFGELYSMQNGNDMSEEQRIYVQELIEKIWGGEA